MELICECGLLKLLVNCSNTGHTQMYPHCAFYDPHKFSCVNVYIPYVIIENKTCWKSVKNNPQLNVTIGPVNPKLVQQFNSKIIAGVGTKCWSNSGGQAASLQKKDAAWPAELLQHYVYLRYKPISTSFTIIAGKYIV